MSDVNEGTTETGREAEPGRDTQSEVAGPDTPPVTDPDRDTRHVGGGTPGGGDAGMGK